MIHPHATRQKHATKRTQEHTVLTHGEEDAEGDYGEHKDYHCSFVDLRGFTTTSLTTSCVWKGCMKAMHKRQLKNFKHHRS